MSAFARDDQGRLCAGGMPLGDIAASHGSPLYVYSGDGIRDDYRRFAAAVAPVDGSVHFALKANSALGVIGLLARHGAGADIVSGGEMARALAAGIPAEKIVFSGVGKSAEEIGAALDAGIGQINAESPQEVEAISQIAAARGVQAPVALRVNVDVAPKTHAKISTGQRSTKFGVSTSQNEAAGLYRKMAADPHIRPAGLAVHIGSQIMELNPFERAYSALLSFGTALRDGGLEVPVLDLGGGIGVDYQDGMPTDFTAYGELVSRLFADSGFRLGFEPGRSIVANNGVLLTRVIYVKDGDNKRFAIVDGAMNDLLRPTLYEAHHDIRPVGPEGAIEGPADIVGPVCETGDYLGLDRMMPSLAAGDCLAVMSSGAYGAVMASSYNTRPPAGEVMVLDGKSISCGVGATSPNFLPKKSSPTSVRDRGSEGAAGDRIGAHRHRHRRLEPFTKNNLGEKFAGHRRTDHAVVGLYDVAAKRITACRQDRHLERRRVRIDCRPVHQLAAQPQCVTGIIGLQIDNLQLVCLRLHRQPRLVEHADQARHIGRDRGPLCHRTDGNTENHYEDDQRRQHSADGTPHFTGIRFGHQHRRFSLPDMRADRTAHRLAAVANTFAVDAKHGLAIRAGEKHRPCVVSW